MPCKGTSVADEPVLVVEVELEEEENEEEEDEDEVLALVLLVLGPAGPWAEAVVVGAVVAR